jgi:hypothetical protein
METAAHCPECGADWSDGQTCTDHFHQMLAWEWEYQLPDVHHLLVLCFHLQHPSRYSPDGLSGAKKLLTEFLEEGVSPREMRERIGSAVDSGTRSYKIKGTPEAHGAYQQPIVWEIVAGDVTRAGVDTFYASVQRWAESVLRSLGESDNLVW